MNLKLAISLFLSSIIAAVVFFGAAFVDEKLVSEYNMVDNFKKNIKRDAKFIPLDYMNEKEIYQCNILYDTIRNSYKNADFITPKNALNNEELYGQIKPSCERDSFDSILFSYLDAGYIYYDLGNEESLIAGKNSNDFRSFVLFSKEKCELNDDISAKDLIGSDNSMVLKIDGKFYLVSEWFKENAYVFYYLDKSSDYDGVNCRFNIIEN